MIPVSDLFDPQTHIHWWDNSGGQGTTMTSEGERREPEGMQAIYGPSDQ